MKQGAGRYALNKSVFDIREPHYYKVRGVLRVIKWASRNYPRITILGGK